MTCKDLQELHAKLVKDFEILSESAKSISEAFGEWELKWFEFKLLEFELKAYN